jgi:hypothetical protein
MTEYIPQDLANAFLGSVDCHFRSLESAYDLSRSLEAKVWGACGAQRVRPEDIGSRFFMLTLTLQGARFSVVVSYGDREHDLGCQVRCSGHRQAYALWEWLEILNRRDLLKDSGAWVLTTSRVESVVSQIEQALEQLAPVVAGNHPSTEQQIEQQRAERLRLDQQRASEDEHTRLAARATEAFRRGDYAAAVEALLAVRVELSASERAKLAYARKKLGQ